MYLSFYHLHVAYLHVVLKDPPPPPSHHISLSNLYFKTSQTCNTTVVFLTFHILEDIQHNILMLPLTLLRTPPHLLRLFNASNATNWEERSVLCLFSARLFTIEKAIGRIENYKSTQHTARIFDFNEAQYTHTNTHTRTHICTQAHQYLARGKCV